jgi:hypothetical protein
MTTVDETTKPSANGADESAQHPYERAMSHFLERRTLANTGRIVIKSEDVPWQQSRQGRSRYYLAHLSVPDTALRDWMVFQKDMHLPVEGRHRHQGGLVIYVTRGSGYSIIDGERVDWKPGDLLVLPVRPGGCDHQHFRDPDSDVTPRWVAFIYFPFSFAMGAMLTQVADAEGWQEQ